MNIIDLARQAGFGIDEAPIDQPYVIQPLHGKIDDELTRFAALVRAQTLEEAKADEQRLVWAMHNMSNPFGRHEFGFSQHVLERGSVGDIDDCRSYIDAHLESLKEKT
jgi:hypothetical protein